MEYVTSERRRHIRYDTEMKVYFRVKYDVKTKVKFTVVKGGLAHKYSGVCKNVSVEGLCFVSHKRLNRGDFLLVEAYEPAVKGPAIMAARVSWCRQLPDNNKKKHMFRAGVRIISVNGEPVRGTISMNEEYKVLWSNLLGSLFGNFAAMIQKLETKKRRLPRGKSAKSPILKAGRKGKAR